MSKKDHIHQLRRHEFQSGNKVFFCVLPDCNYKVKTPLALGKRSLCNRCGKPFIMNEYSIRLVRPHCSDCHKSKDHSDSKKIKFDNGSTITLGNSDGDAYKGSDHSVLITDNSGESLAERLAKAVNKPVEGDEEI